MKAKPETASCGTLPFRVAASLAALLLGAGIVSAENWPQWRGPFFNCSSPETNLPTEWSASNHVIWSARLPGPGGSTPVVWGDYLFLSAADKSAKTVLALGFDTRTGRELWRHPLSATRGTPGANDMASPSPVTDGQRAWFLSGNGMLAAFTREGQEVWRRDLGKEYGTFVVNFGYSSSPLLFDNRLYVLAMQNENPKQSGLNPDREGPLDSYLLAVEPITGRTQWRHVRPTDAEDQSREAYMTPYPLVWNGRRELVLSGGECVTGHNPATGEELWRWWFTPPDREKLQHVVPTPVAYEDLVYVIRPEHRPLFALRTGGRGLLTNDCIAWQYESNKSWIASPLVYRGRLYVTQEEQQEIICMDLRTGRVVWQHKVPARTSLQASLTGADGKLYCISLSGEVVVLAAGDEYRELASFRLEEAPYRSTIVAANGRLFVRTAKNLYCVGLAGSGK